MTRWNVYCDLAHDRPKRAVIRVQVKSNRAGTPGRPMERDLALCGSHAQRLRELGVDVVRP
jgi:hypothetical protein